MRFLRPDQVARRLGVSRRHLDRVRAEAGDFPEPVYLSGRCPRWPEEALDAWMARKGRDARILQDGRRGTSVTAPGR